MRVAVLARDYPPKVGGGSTYANALVPHLRSLGVDVGVFAGLSDSKTILLSLNNDFHDYDLVHVQSSPYGAFVRKKPLVVTVFAPVLSEWRHYSLHLKAKSVVAYACEKLALRKATIIAISEQTRYDVKTMYGVSDDRIQVIPCGVEYDKFAISRKYTFDSPIRILLLSRLEPRKNVAEALRALSSLPFDSYQARVVGDGSQMEPLKKMAKDLRVNVEFSGRIDGEGLPKAYNEADIFITSSFSEGFGLTILEAMASGCAVIASNIPAHREIVRNGIDGILYDDLTDLIRSLKIFISDPGLVASFGRRALQRARDYSWDDVARRTRDVYERCLAL